jgi:hypothetical protein
MSRRRYQSTIRPQIGRVLIALCLLAVASGRSRRLAVWTHTGSHSATLAAANGSFDVVGDAGNRSQAQSGASGLELTLTEHPQYIIPRVGRISP